jgi:hypothetical protein
MYKRTLVYNPSIRNVVLGLGISLDDYIGSGDVRATCV